MMEQLPKAVQATGVPATVHMADVLCQSQLMNANAAATGGLVAFQRRFETGQNALWFLGQPAQ